MSILAIRLSGHEPGMLMHNLAMSLDVNHPSSRELADLTSRSPKEKKRPEVVARTQRLECLRSMYRDANDQPTLPAGMFRSAIEGAARKNKEGPLVRGGLFMLGPVTFEWDQTQGKTVEELADNEQVRFTTPVRVGQQRVLRTRALFNPWAAEFRVDIDDELIDVGRMQGWLELAGRRIGVGDWRPDKSGIYGQFSIDYITPE